MRQTAPYLSPFEGVDTIMGGVGFFISHEVDEVDKNKIILMNDSMNKCASLLPE